MKLSDGSTVGHVPDPLACVLAFMLNYGEIAHMSGTINDVPRPATECVWVPGGGIEIEYVLNGMKKDHSSNVSEMHRSYPEQKTEVDFACCMCTCMPATLLCSSIDIVDLCVPHRKQSGSVLSAFPEVSYLMS